MTVYYENDADIDFLKNKTVAVIGYGNQGRAQALNLRDSGLEVIIGVRADETRDLAMKEGFQAFSIPEASERAQVALLLIPDEIMPEVYQESILPGLVQGDAICFASGYNVAFGFIQPPDLIDVVMVAPRMIGDGVRQKYVEGKGFPSFIGVHQDASGHALKTTLAIAKGIGSTRSGAMQVSFSQEAELDLFTEQAFGPAFGAVLISAIQTLIDYGYPVEAAMIELILSGEFAYSMEKIAELGFFKQMELHSHTSQYGSMTRSLRFAIPQIGDSMKVVLDEIRSGAFAREWDNELKGGMTVFNQMKELRTQHPIAEWERKARQAFRMD